MPANSAPAPTPETQLFWDKALLGELWFPRCDATGRIFFPPRAFSPFGGGTVSWVEASGRARLASYVIAHRPAPGFETQVPYIIAIAETEEGPRLLTNLPGAPPEPAALHIGAPLEVAFERRGEVMVPQFRLVRSAT